jgi:hypothetical protein
MSSTDDAMKQLISQIAKTLRQLANMGSSNIDYLRIRAVTALAICALSITAPAALAAKKDPFTGNWISIQYTNGKEFLLKLQQIDHELIGWEGKLPPDTEKLAPDLKGQIKGKVADVEVQHRRGYQAHALLTLQGDKLVWQLLESDNRSSRYFPLASTLSRKDDDEIPAASQFTAVNNSGAQPLISILEQASTFDAALGAVGPSTSASFGAYRALVNRNLKADDISLQTLLKGKSPAGRLYAAAIIWEINHDAGMDAFKSLATDNAQVEYKSGEKVIATAVSAIARSFLEKGSYMDFPSKKY